MSQHAVNDHMQLVANSIHFPSPKTTRKLKQTETGHQKEGPSHTSQRKGAMKTDMRTANHIPTGDVRLTANIREELHLRLKIEAAKRRTTIGDLIEELVEQYLQ